MDQHNGNIFWTDLRSKRNITAAHLSQITFDDYQFYDPLLSPNVGVVRVAPGIDWFSQGFPNSWQLNLHSFRFADYWLLQYLNSGDDNLLRRLDVAMMDYLEKVWQNQTQIKKSKSKAYKHVHSDTAVANRAAVLAFLLGRGNEGFRLKDPSQLRIALCEHVAHAASDDHYNSNNHGLFNDLHLLMGLINAPKEQSLHQVAPKVLSRLLTTYLERQVNAEGVHLEHTPSYAVLWVLLGRKILEVLERLTLVFPGLASNGALRVRESMELVTNNLWWFTKPNGELVNFGEQGRTDAATWIPHDAFSLGAKLFQDSGYGFYKDEQSYLGFVAAYHASKAGRSGYRSASHKQRDELHLVWFDAGGDVLIDPGLRAYDFGPERFYVTSKAAHNTVCVGAEDFIGDSILKYMDKTAPYGGAIQCSDVQQMPDGSSWSVMLGHDPLLARRNIQHTRAILLDPGRWLVIIDNVCVNNEEVAEWNFHFSERWRSNGYDKSRASFISEDWILKMTRFSDADADAAEAMLYMGSFVPLRGWRFSGGPIAAPNLNFREALPPKKSNIRAHAFRLAKTMHKKEIEKDGVSFVEVLSRGGYFKVRLSLVDNGKARDLDFSIPFHQ